MTPEQRSKLQALLPGMRTMARRKVSQNEFTKAIHQAEQLSYFLSGGETYDNFTAEEWIAIAEKAAAGSDQPGTIRMTMEQVLTGKPPEFFLKKGD